ncbi:glutathione S-transferase family protein [Roseibium sp.]|uniref:glutathione S-transferase family protein n=1 Tax=Roseibium sp. TaxID=1936156 RepID=UPI003D0E52F0
MSTQPTLVSHTLCPYVQRAAIVLLEKGATFDRVYIDLNDKPEWFSQASPLGKVPLLKTEDGSYLFESAPIVEFLDETYPGRLHPQDPIEKARHRAYIEFASQTLNGIGALYNAPDEVSFDAASTALHTRFQHLETVIDPDGPFFAGPRLTLVDAAFAPVFRYFDVFEEFVALRVLHNLPLTQAWRLQLAERSSVQNAVGATYGDDLKTFLRKRGSWMTGLLGKHEQRARRTNK